MFEDRERPDKGCEWHFERQTGQDEGPNDALTQNFKKRPYVSLIRESIQNSLDAVADKSKPVHVVVKHKKMHFVQYRKFFDLKDHIQGCLDLYKHNENAKSIYTPMLEYLNNNDRELGVIMVEDYNTKGMFYQRGDTNCSFYAFALAKGVSAKENQSSGGSFGFGKAAYFNVSPIRTVFISSLTPAGQHVFEGVSSLCTHTFKGEKLTSVGYYDNNEGKPITNAENIPKLFLREEPGTTISIIGTDFDDAKPMREMVETVLRSFWLAIYSNQLSVDIMGLPINSNNLANLMEHFFQEEIDETKRATAHRYNPRPYFDAVRFASNDNPRYVKVEKCLPILKDVELFINLHPNNYYVKR